MGQVREMGQIDAANLIPAQNLFTLFSFNIDLHEKQARVWVKVIFELYQKLLKASYYIFANHGRTILFGIESARRIVSNPILAIHKPYL